MSRAYVLTLLPLLVGATASGALAAPQEGKATDSALTITGTVVDEAGATLAGRKVWLLGKNFSIKLDGKGTVLGPAANTDDRGAFRLKVDRALFSVEEELSVALEYKDSRGMTNWAPLHDGRGIPATLKIDRKLKVLDLGRLAFKVK
jgi:hypothetical protein